MAHKYGEGTTDYDELTSAELEYLNLHPTNPRPNLAPNLFATICAIFVPIFATLVGLCALLAMLQCCYEAWQRARQQERYRKTEAARLTQFSVFAWRNHYSALHEEFDPSELMSPGNGVINHSPPVTTLQQQYPYACCQEAISRQQSLSAASCSSPVPPMTHATRVQSYGTMAPMTGRLSTTNELGVRPSAPFSPAYAARPIKWP